MDKTFEGLDSDFSMRHHDIDWLRVIMFGLLIPYHAAIGFTGWSVYAYANNDQGGFILNFFLLFMHQWRLPVLFMISGMGTYFAIKRRSGKQFVFERTKRLIIPLIFGMNFIVIFQGYYALFHWGKIDTIFEFALNWWEKSGEVQHLWFLGNLFVYSLLNIPLYLYFKKNPNSFIPNTIKKILGFSKGLGLLFIIPIPLILVELFIKPIAYGIVGLGYEFPWYLIFFSIGYLLIMAGNSYWIAIEKVRFPAIILGITTSIMLYYLMVIADTISYGYGNLILNGGWYQYGDTYWSFLTITTSIIHAMNSWFWSIAVLSWGAKYLNKPHKYLTYLNQAVYPFYLVHMSFILVALYYMKDLELYWLLKFIIITLLTILGCLSTFEVVKRNKVSKVLFGIK